MPKTPKTPPLSDWRVIFTEPAAGLPAITVRATHLRTPAGWVFLDDAAGDHLLAVPAQHVAYVKRLEPGEDVPAAREAPEEIAEPPSVPSLPGPHPPARSKRSGARS